MVFTSLLNASGGFTELPDGRGLRLGGTECPLCRQPLSALEAEGLDYHPEPTADDEGENESESGTPRRSEPADFGDGESTGVERVLTV